MQSPIEIMNKNNKKKNTQKKKKNPIPSWLAGTLLIAIPGLVPHWDEGKVRGLSSSFPFTKYANSKLAKANTRVRRYFHSHYYPKNKAGVDQSGQDQWTRLVGKIDHPFLILRAAGFWSRFMDKYNGYKTVKSGARLRLYRLWITRMSSTGNWQN